MKTVKKIEIEILKKELENKVPVRLIAEKFSVSRQYIYFLIKKYKLPLPKRTKRIVKCTVCGKEFKNSQKQKIYFCSKECHRNYFYTTFKCEVCGTIFYRRKKEVEYKEKHGRKIKFCSRKCLGKWLGINYGWKAKYRK